MQLEHILDQIYPLSDAAKAKLIHEIVEVHYPKGHILMHSTKFVKAIYLIKIGIVRAYSDHDGSEITFWFGKEGEAVISMKNYVEQKKSYENIELLEDCVLYELDNQRLNLLYHSDIEIANWGRRFAEKELVKTEERLISRHLGTAINRYSELLKHDHQLIQRVALGHIASYLGITQVSLSRIRAELR